MPHVSKSSSRPLQPFNDPKGEQKANRECFLLETHVTPTKQTLAVSSNREENGIFQIEKSPNSTQIASSEHQQPEPIAHEITKRDPPAFVAIKTTPNSLFSISYDRFLISPCSDYSTTGKHPVPNQKQASLNPPKPHPGKMGHPTNCMKTPIKFGILALAGTALLLASALPGWAQRGGGHGGGMASGGHIGGGVARAPIMSSAPRAMPRPGPRATAAPMTSRPVALRTRTSAAVRTSRPATNTSANRRTVVSYRTTRDRYGRLHRVRVISFVGGFGYPGYYGYYPYDYGFDQSDYNADQNNYAAAPDAAPAPDQYAAAPAVPAGPSDASSPDVGQLILVRKDGQIVTPNAFAIAGDQLVYITRQGARLSFPVADLDKDTTRKMNAANGTNIAIPD
jgi:hypothetical protein